MSISERAQATLHQTESQLRQLLAEAAEAGDYATVVEVAALAKGVRDLLRERPTEAVKGTPVATRQKILPSHARNYPRFGRREDMLIRVSWSKAEKREYEQRASFSTLMRVVSLIADAGTDDRVFATEDIVPAMDGAASEIPSYQVYIVVGLLRHAGLIEQHGRRGYSIPDASQLKNSITTLWQGLPHLKAEA